MTKFLLTLVSITLLGAPFANACNCCDKKKKTTKKPADATQYEEGKRQN